MTTVSADRATRIRQGTSAGNRAGARGVLTAMLLVLLAVLIVDNHLMALPGRSFADIGVSGAVLRDPVRSLLPPRQAAPEAVDAVVPRATARSAHELHHCFVHARRSGQDPAACRTRR
jgi:hypothetical protein